MRRSWAVSRQKLHGSELRARTLKPAKKSPMRLWWLLIGGIFACERPAARRPEELAYQAFAEAVRRGDSAAAWGTLSQRTRQLMEAKAKVVSEASAGVVKDEPALMLFQSGTRPSPAGEVRVLESDGGTAVIEVSVSGRPHRVVMVRESDRWMVDLSDVLHEEANQP